MSWFRKQKEPPKPLPSRPRWLTNPNDLDSYPKYPKESLKAAKQAIEKLLLREAASVKALGLPLPRILDIGFTFTSAVKRGYENVLLEDNDHLFGSATMKLPSFDIPTHEQFMVRKLPDPPLPYNEREYPDHYRYRASLYSTYVVIADEDALELFREEVKYLGLSCLVYSDLGVWCNRDPYKLYKDLNMSGHITYSFDNEFYGNSPTRWRYFDLKPHEGYTSAQLAAMHRALHFFAAVFPPGYIDLVPKDLYIKNHYSDIVPDEVLAFILPEPVFPESVSRIKILPTLGTKLSSAKSFLNNLRSISRAVAFEIVFENDTIAFHLSCATLDLPLITEQLQVHFPDFATMPSQEIAPVVPSALYSQTAVPVAPALLLRLLGDGGADPYNQLFFILNQLPARDFFFYQVTFVPLNESYISSLVTFFEKRWRHDRGKDLQKKFPPFLACVKLMTTNKAALEKTVSNFFIAI